MYNNLKWYYKFLSISYTNLDGLNTEVWSRRFILHNNLLETVYVLYMGRCVCYSMYTYLVLEKNAEKQLPSENCETYLNLEPLGVSVP